jgi:bifunctional polynucleotide phosphatase/kinase
VGRRGVQEGKPEVAGFDFDDTLVTVRGKHTHPKGPEDWQFFDGSVPERIRGLHNKGFRIVIFSNQKGIAGDDEKSRMRKAYFIGRAEAVACRLKEVPLLFLAATADDFHRKPRPGMFQLFTRSFNGGIAVDTEGSFFVGNAAGREDGRRPGGKKDHADSDYKFALNIGCKFQVPEAFFQRAAPVNLPDPAFQPRKTLDAASADDHPPGAPHLPELLVFVAGVR